MISDFANNTFSDNDLAPLRIGAENLYRLDKNSVFTGNGTQAIEVASAGSTNAVFNSTGTVPALALPYHFYSSAELRTTVTFEAGVTCLFDAAKRLWVTGDGAIIANGTSTNRIKFSGLTSTAGFWFGIEMASPSTSNLINQAEISYGGSNAGRGANIYMPGASPGTSLTVTNCTIKDSQTYGILTAAGTANLTQNSNTFSNNASGNIQQN
ncbi:MAG: right-handed parallel beta-helix repeat-containing protein [Flammeovirgaceae bacterium]|nr:right-handed parallel beta-helix repeat-containing protein [Flammeovirgaceae bacterium]